MILKPFYLYWLFPPHQGNEGQPTKHLMERLVCLSRALKTTVWQHSHLLDTWGTAPLGWGPTEGCACREGREGCPPRRRRGSSVRPDRAGRLLPTGSRSPRGSRRTPLTLHPPRKSTWEKWSMDEFTSLYHTLVTLLPLRSLCDFPSQRVHWTWLGRMPPDPPPLSMPILWTIHTPCHTHWMCLCNSVTLHSGHMTSIVPSILERGPSLLLSWRVLHFFLPRESYSSGVFPDPMWGQRSGMSYVYIL